MTGVSGLVRHSKPFLALPCTLNELIAFENKAYVFRERLEAGNETEALILEISKKDPDAGILARALMFGEIPGDDVKLTTTPAPVATKGAIKAQPRARRDLVTPAIEAAQKGLKDIFDTPAVWTAMTEMAQAQKNRLRGVTEDGIQWMDDEEEIKYLKKKNLGERLRRMKKSSLNRLLKYFRRMQKNGVARVADPSPNAKKSLVARSERSMFCGAGTQISISAAC